MFDYYTDADTILFNVYPIKLKEMEDAFGLLLKQKDEDSFTIFVNKPNDPKNDYDKISITDFYKKVAGLEGLVTMKKLQEYAFRKY